MTQIVYNSAITEIIKVLLFYINYRFNLKTSEERKLIKIALKVKIQVHWLKNLHKTLQYDIKFISEQSAVYYNKKRDKELTLKERDKVYLLHCNIKTR